MQSKKLFQILFGVIIAGAFLAAVYFMGKEYGWFGTSVPSAPVERQKTKEELIMERISAPPEAEPVLTEEEEQELIKRLSAPPDAKPKLTEEEYQQLLQRLGP
jgi:hypothetical protein